MYPVEPIISFRMAALSQHLIIPGYSLVERISSARQKQLFPPCSKDRQGYGAGSSEATEIRTAVGQVMKGQTVSAQYSGVDFAVKTAEIQDAGRIISDLLCSCFPDSRIVFCQVIRSGQKRERFLRKGIML